MLTSPLVPEKLGAMATTLSIRMLLATIGTITGVTAASAPRRLGTPHFDTTHAGYVPPTAFNMRSRVKVPYAAGTGYAFGFGAAEQIAYDHVEKYLYTASEQGAINVVDYNDPAAPAVVANVAIDLTGQTLTDVEVCPSKGWLIVAMGAATKTDNGKVQMYSTVQRSAPAMPSMLKEMTVGPLPDMILPNMDCTKIAVANEGEGRYSGSVLTDPEGSVDIITNLDQATPTVTRVRFDTASGTAVTDAYLEGMGVHLPLSKNAMEYWDDHSSVNANLDFSSARASYTAMTNLEPEYLGWSYDGMTLYVNMQENNAVAEVAVPASGTPSLTAIHPLGLKDWSATPIDVESDGQCVLKTHAGLWSARMPDSIAVVNVDGTDYVVTANEGDDKDYGDFEEKWKASDLLDDSGNPKEGTMTIDTATKDHYVAQNGNGANKKRRITVGSAGVDYSNPQAPNIHRLVLFGGRGITIYRHDANALTEVWDSGDHLEKEGCAAYSWAHNGIQDEEFASKWGALYNASDADFKSTLDDMNDKDEDGCTDRGDGMEGACPLGSTKDDRSPKDGSAPEAIVAGVACGRLLAVTASEKQSIAYVYDISTITSPSLLFVKHLSPASENLSPDLAYDQGVIGEIDSEGMVFLEAAHSPSGKAGVLFAGAWSGTVSFWEFECPATTTMTTTTNTMTTMTTATVMTTMAATTLAGDGDASGAARVAPVAALLFAVMALVRQQGML